MGFRRPWACHSRRAQRGVVSAMEEERKKENEAAAEGWKGDLKVAITENDKEKIKTAARYVKSWFDRGYYMHSDKIEAEKLLETVADLFGERED